MSVGNPFNDVTVTLLRVLKEEGQGGIITWQVRERDWVIVYRNGHVGAYNTGKIYEVTSCG